MTILWLWPWLWLLWHIYVSLGSLPQICAIELCYIQAIRVVTPRARASVVMPISSSSLMTLGHLTVFPVTWTLTTSDFKDKRVTKASKFNFELQSWTSNLKSNFNFKLNINATIEQYLSENSLLNRVKSGQIIIDKIGGPNRERHQGTDEILVADDGGPIWDRLQVASNKTGGPNWERHSFTGEILITDSGGPNGDSLQVASNKTVGPNW